MKRSLITVAALVAVAGPAAAQKPDSTVAPLDAIVAIVGTVPITRYDIEQRLADSVRALRARNLPMPTEARRRDMLLATLNSVVDEAVLLRNAKEMAIEASDTDATTYTAQQAK